MRKRLGLVMLLLFSCFLAIGCSGQSEDPDYRKIAWQHLTKEDRARVTEHWTEGEVTEVEWAHVMLKEEEPDRGAHDRVIRVQFDQTSGNEALDAQLGPLSVVIDPRTLDVLGIEANY